MKIPTIHTQPTVHTQETIRHSLAHILAAAVQELYPGTKFGIGPATEHGFYYDFDLKRSLGPEDLPKIEKKMKELIKKDIKFEKKIISKEEAKKMFKDQSYKLELIEEIPEKNVSIYRSGKFIDLCKGPHIQLTKESPINFFKLTKIAGAYWKGDEKNPMLTRIYGVAFKTKKELDNHLFKEAEAKKRDHRLLGQKLELFMFDEEVGAGLPLWLPKGATLRHLIEDYLYKELTSQGYSWIATPHIAKLNLWKTSGHWTLFRENIYSPIKIDEEEYLLKPMNCPFHVKIYNAKIRSYKDLPLYLAELGTVYRYEKSGVLHGLTRARGFTQDDAHIICEPGQLAEELTKLLKYGLKILKTFGFKNYEIYLSTQPEKYQTDPGGGVFYGPKIDIKIKDSLGRPWQCTTIQVDFNLPERFKMKYIDHKGKKQQPLMIHRALLGSLERFIGVLLEHYAGNLPLWLAPVQIWIIPVGTPHEKYASSIREQLSDIGYRVKVKDEAETVSKKIREGEIQKIPYLIVVGDKEMKLRAVRVRSKNKDLGMIKLNKFLEKVKIRLQRKS